SAENVPSLPRASSSSVGFHPLKSPATKTLSAFGAQTRKVVPPAYGIAPMPGRLDGVAGAVAGTKAGGGGGTPSASKRRTGLESKLDTEAGGLGAIGAPPRVPRRSDAGLDGANVRV